MRFLLGVVTGVALTVGVAWVVDSRRAADGIEGPLVNWEQVDRSWTDVRRNVRRTFDNTWRAISG